MNALMLMASAFTLAITPVHAAKVLLRLHEDDGQYSGVFRQLSGEQKQDGLHAS
jgi:hypothetical protein